jgi:uncharacterized coiled-coil protein SlyX
MSKTIKQIADELGVSKQAVQKRLSREPLCTSIQPYISTINGVKYIEVVGENLIKSAFSKSAVDNVSIDKSNLSTDVSIDKNNLSPVIEVLQTTIDTLQSQLEIKDKLIEQLRAELAEERQHSRELSDKLAVIADQAQQLQLAQIATSSDVTPAIEDSHSQTSKRHWWQKVKRA